MSSTWRQCSVADSVNDYATEDHRYGFGNSCYTRFPFCPLDVDCKILATP